MGSRPTGVHLAPLLLGAVLVASPRPAEAGPVALIERDAAGGGGYAPGAFVDMLTSAGVSFDTYGTYAGGGTTQSLYDNLHGYSLLIFASNAGQDPAIAVTVSMTANQQRLRDWIYAGGNLFMSVYNDAGKGADLLALPGIAFTINDEKTPQTIVTSDPILTTPNDVANTVRTTYTWEALTAFPPSSTSQTTILRGSVLSYNSMASFRWGAGRVVFSGAPVRTLYVPFWPGIDDNNPGDGARFLKNVVVQMGGGAPPPGPAIRLSFFDDFESYSLGPLAGRIAPNGLAWVWRAAGESWSYEPKVRPTGVGGSKAMGNWGDGDLHGSVAYVPLGRTFGPDGDGNDANNILRWGADLKLGTIITPTATEAWATVDLIDTVKGGWMELGVQATTTTAQRAFLARFGGDNGYVDVTHFFITTSVEWLSVEGEINFDTWQCFYRFRPRGDPAWAVVNTRTYTPGSPYNWIYVPDALQAYTGGNDTSAGGIDNVYVEWVGPRPATLSALYEGAVLADAPIAHWRLGEASGPAAMSRVGALHGAYLGTPSYARVGAVPGDTAVTFGATNLDYAIRNPVGTIPTSAASVEFWMRTSDASSMGTPFSYAAAGSPGGNELLVDHYEGFYLTVGGLSAGPAFAANDGSWHHIVATWESSSGATRLYKDGVLGFSGTLQQGYSLKSGGAVVLGQEQDSVGGTFDSAQRFIGLLDEVALYGSVLSAERVLAHYRAAHVRVWVGGGGDANWTNAANWSAGAVPAAEDDVWVDVAGPGQCVVSATATIRSLTLPATFTGTVTVDAPLAIGQDLAVTSGTLKVGTGSLAVTGTVTVNGGTLWGSVAGPGGPITLTAGGTLRGTVSVGRSVVVGAGGRIAPGE